MQYNFTSITPRYGTGSNKWTEIQDALPGFQGDILPFSVADMEFETAPEIRAGLKEYIDRYVLGYANPTEEFKSSVCGWMKRRHNWEIQPDWIISSHGIIKAFFTAVRAYTKPGEGVMLMTPVYYPMYAAIEKNQRLRETFYSVELTECTNPKCNILGYEANRIAYEQCEGWLEEALKVIDTNRRMVEDFMKKEFPMVRITPLEGTYLLWMDFNAMNIDCMELAWVLREKAQMFFDDGYIFGDSGRGFERWNLACPTRYIAEGLARMKTALAPYRPK